jgi:hypothetical protein
MSNQLEGQQIDEETKKLAAGNTIACVYQKSSQRDKDEHRPIDSHRVRNASNLPKRANQESCRSTKGRGSA